MQCMVNKACAQKNCCERVCAPVQATSHANFIIALPFPPLLQTSLSWSTEELFLAQVFGSEILWLVAKFSFAIVAKAVKHALVFPECSSFALRPAKTSGRQISVYSLGVMEPLWPPTMKVDGRTTFWMNQGHWRKVLWLFCVSIYSFANFFINLATFLPYRQHLWLSFCCEFINIKRKTALVTALQLLCNYIIILQRQQFYARQLPPKRQCLSIWALKILMRRWQIEKVVLSHHSRLKAHHFFIN